MPLLFVGDKSIIEKLTKGPWEPPDSSSMCQEQIVLFLAIFRPFWGNFNYVICPHVTRKERGNR